MINFTGYYFGILTKISLQAFNPLVKNLFVHYYSPDESLTIEYKFRITILNEAYR
jgi:hypothetical protein